MWKFYAFIFNHFPPLDLSLFCFYTSIILSKPACKRESETGIILLFQSSNYFWSFSLQAAEGEVVGLGACEVLALVWVDGVGADIDEVDEVDDVVVGVLGIFAFWAEVDDGGVLVDKDGVGPGGVGVTGFC